MIKSTAFKHGSNTYHYRQHQAKCEKFLSGTFASLGSHLLSTASQSSIDESCNCCDWW